ncbi:MAG: c-type cytochrome [Phycisphaerales bacterium]|nr:c-type cytochrome [Phycisphaerales bacterium]
MRDGPSAWAAILGGACVAAAAAAQAPPATAISVPEGFAVDLVASAQAGEGSWVALTFASTKVAFVAAQNGGLFRLTLSDDGGSVTRTELIPTPFHGAEGLLVDGSTLYAVAEGEVAQGGGLWRLIDSDGDGSFDISRRLLEFGGGGEHGIHGIRKGADGFLYVIAGNHVAPPKWIASDSPVAHWDEDFLQEREWDARGHAVGMLAPGGFVLRVDPQSCEGDSPCHAQLWCAGMRNAYDLVQIPSGDWFTYDSDMEWDIGAPWYKSPRIVQLVSGGDSGWRSGSANSPWVYADHQTPVCETDESSPTGVEWGGGGSFPGPWRDRLLVGDWAYGRILAVDLAARGAGYMGASRLFASGRPMPVTDLAWGSGGALYFTTGGRGLSSGLYRIRVEDAVLAALSAGGPIAADSRAASARARRTTLEVFHSKAASRADMLLIIRELSATDPMIAAAARVALENQPVSLWRGDAERAGPLAWLALARAGGDADRTEVLRLVTDAAPEAGDLESRSVLVRIATIALSRLGGDTKRAKEAAAAMMDSWYPSGDSELDEILLPLLVEGRRAQVIERGLGTLARMDPAEGMRVLLALRSVQEGWTPNSRAQFARAIARARELRGGLSLQGFVDAIEQDALRAFLANTPEAAMTRPKEDHPSALAIAAEAAAERLDDDGHRSIHEWTVEEIAPMLNFDLRSRDLARGKRVFEQATCTLCHRFGGEGGSSGPDLTGAGSRLSRRDLVVTTLEPSLAISDQYADEVFTLRDGSVVIGRIVGETTDDLVVRINPVADERERVSKAEIASRVRSEVSPMPRGLLNAFTHDEIVDLLAYLETRPTEAK